MTPKERSTTNQFLKEHRTVEAQQIKLALAVVDYRLISR
jgi:hypothetical protein